MDSKINKKIRNLFKSWVFWLLLVTGIAIIIRSIPAWVNVAWGGDFGIYFGLAKDFVKTGALYNPYYGWGNSYNYFPVLYSISGIAHWITGLDILTVMTKMTPIFGGLTVFIFYFLVYEIVQSKKIAILSSLFLAVMPFHVYQLSHASPLTIGHFFMILSFYFFIKYRKNTLYIYPLILSTILLIMSHHLTTYFYLISIVFVMFFENASRGARTPYLKKDFFYIIFTSVIIFAYWAFIATPVYENFMKKGINIFGVALSSELTIVLFYVVFFGSFVVARLVRKFSKYLIDNKTDINSDNKLLLFLYMANPFIKKDYPSVKSRAYLFVLGMIVYISALLYFTNRPLPWAGFPLTIDAIILITPFLIVLAFALAGFRYTNKIRNGFIIRGWIFALIFSLFYTMFSGYTLIFPHRHFEYLMYPVSILAVLGIGSFFSDPEWKKMFSRLKRNVKFKRGQLKKFFSNHGMLCILLVTVLVITNAVSVYPAHYKLNESSPRVRDVIYAEDIAVILWMSENLDKNKSLVVSDHCLERMIESEDFNTTQDEIVDLWTSENVSGCLEELFGIGGTHGKITHVVIDKMMKEDSVQYGCDLGKPRWAFMTNETSNKSYDKFLEQPFELIYRNESLELDLTGKPIYWAEVYQVNWSYIEDYIMHD